MTPGPTTPDPTTPGPPTPDPTTPGPTTPEPTTLGPTTPEPTTSGPTTPEPTTSGPTTPEPTTPGPTTPEPTTTGVPSSSTPTEIPYCSSKCLYCFSFLRSKVFSLDISIIPVDYDTRLTVLSASVSVFVVNAESVYPLITGVTVDSVLGVAAVRIPFEATLLLLVQASGYSTASRSYNSYCSTGNQNRCNFLFTSSTFIGNSIKITLKRRVEAVSFTYNASSSLSLVSTDFSLSVGFRFPPDSLDVPTGTSLVLNLNVIDPFVGVALAPQLFAERLITGNRTYLDSLALGDMVITNAETNETVNLKRPVELVFQLNGTANVADGELIPAWSFDDQRGIWIEEGLGVVSMSPGGNFVWSFNISRLSWWNCDRPWTDKNCINVHVGYIKNGDVSPSPLSGALVSIEGLSYNYFAVIPTSPTGETCLEAKREEISAIRVNVLASGYVSDEVLVHGSPTSSFCALSSLLWTSNLLAVGGQCEGVDILCKNALFGLF